jgi:hypothetical protein
MQRVRMPKDGAMHTYRFVRALTEKQAWHLTLIIGYRRGAAVLCAGDPERVVGCVTTPADLHDFLRRYPRRVNDLGPTAEEGR